MQQTTETNLESIKENNPLYAQQTQTQPHKHEIISLEKKTHQIPP